VIEDAAERIRAIVHCLAEAAPHTPAEEVPGYVLAVEQRLAALGQWRSHAAEGRLADEAVLARAAYADPLVRDMARAGDERGAADELWWLTGGMVAAATIEGAVKTLVNVSAT